jgi:hypothetical protein
VARRRRKQQTLGDVAARARPGGRLPPALVAALTEGSRIRSTPPPVRRPPVGSQGPARRGAAQPLGPVQRPRPARGRGGREAALLRAQVARERRRLEAGRGARVDAGDLLRAATPAGRRAARENVTLGQLRPARQRRPATLGEVAARGDTAQLKRIARGPTSLRVPSPKRLSFTQALVQEVSGKGLIAKELAKVLVPSSKPVTFTVNGKKHVFRPGEERVAGISGAPRMNDVSKAFVADAVRLPRDSVQSMYEIGAAAKEAAGGDTKRAKRLIGGLDDGVVGQLVVHGSLKGALKAFEEHPLYGALEITGVGQAAGRLAGAGARAGLAGEAARAAAGTKRAPLRVEGSHQQLERRYSPNVIVKGLQVAAERDARKRGFDPNVAGGRRRDRLLNAEVDEFAAQAEGVRRRGREEAARVAARIAPVRRGDVRGGRRAQLEATRDRARSQAAEATGARGRPERDVVLAAVEGRLRGPQTFREDLLRERSRLQSVYDEDQARPIDGRRLSASARKANRMQVRALDRTLRDPAAMANKHEVFRAADDYNRAAGAIERDLIDKGALDPAQADAARLRTYGVSVMGLRPAAGKGARGLVDDAGRAVSTDEIKAHIARTGNREPGFVAQRRADRGAPSFFVNWYGGRKTVDSKRRTGEAARTGAYDASFKALEENLVRGRGVVDAIGTFDDFVGRMGTRRRDGTPFQYDEAVRAADELRDATGMEWLPVRAVPARYDRATQEQILERQGTAALPQDLQALTKGRLDDSLKPPQGPEERKARNVVLVSAQQVQRFAAHQTKGSSTGAKAGQALTRAFRSTVLPFSVKWLTGNVAEATLRSAAYGITPLDVARGARVMRSLRQIDEQAWKAADERIRGGLLYGSAERLNVRRGAEDFERTALEEPAKAAVAVARMPLVRQTLTGLRAYTRAVFALNRGLERAFQTGVIGKAARREAQELTGSWGKALRMQEDVAKEVAQGLLGTPKQVQFARYADEVLGKYSRFSPDTRRVIQTFAPFLPWFLNAARFVYWTLPVKHPLKTALLANVEVTLRKDLDDFRKTVPPGDLESAIRTKDGGLVNVARYTPFGAFTKGAEGIADPLLPQIDSAVAALKGQSFTGKPLKVKSGQPPTEGQKLWLAFHSLLEGAVPGLQIARRLQEKGATPYDDSTAWAPKTKPGTARTSAFNRLFNPVRPTYLHGGGPGGGSGAAAATLSPAQAREAVMAQREALAEQAAAQREALLEQAAQAREARALAEQLAREQRRRP